jgi:DNA-binding IclR family transcriptional regulator
MAAGTGVATTAMDMILDELKRNGRTEINLLAKQCGMNTMDLDRLARILEKNRIVKISAEFGTVYVELTGVSPEDIHLPERW